ncbi:MULTISPECIES: hypothetical protein [Amycolatopsis]|uniref:Uncharacterized protein n=2 Tax=Amycolatopsis sacchari TaxID=115433 RepID=A0A1I4DTU6_9PSEU|nr:hypothetical protein [Amycolatopsis sacchari]SFK97042.1 hypothetical protein SAMN05421835_1622 [Amycolatopsis sacchari]
MAPEGDPAPRTALVEAMARAGIDTGAASWMSPVDSQLLVDRWKQEFGAQRYGTLVAVAPESGSVRDTLRPGVQPSWLAGPAEPVFVLFGEYAQTGLLVCGWPFLASNLTPLARADGNGFVATTRDWTGALVVDVEGDVLEVEAWGVFVSGAR